MPQSSCRDHPIPRDVVGRDCSPSSMFQVLSSIHRENNKCARPFGSLIGQTKKGNTKRKNEKKNVRYEHHPIFNCWDAVLWLDLWKRTVIYTILAVLLFAQPHRAWFTTVGGLMLIALGLLHAARWYRKLKSVPMSLIEQQEDGYGMTKV